MNTLPATDRLLLEVKQLRVDGVETVSCERLEEALEACKKDPHIDFEVLFREQTYQSQLRTWELKHEGSARSFEATLAFARQSIQNAVLINGAGGNKPTNIHRPREPHE